MTERLYYTDATLLEFDAKVSSTRTEGATVAVVLDRSAFYPAGGGQNFDTGWLEASGGQKLQVKEVLEDEATGDVLHWLDSAPVDGLMPGSPLRGTIDAQRRRDHMQQHSGQHLLSAAFERLFGFATVSFHMGAENCTIDLATEKLAASEVEAAELLANQVITENRPVAIRFVSPEEARTLGVRKIPATERAQLRLIDIRDFDLNACGGTHVGSTGQIGSILLRKAEKVKQGWRVEFVCGLRAVATARRDFQTLTEASAVFSTHIWEVPAQARKALDDVKAAQKAHHRRLEEIAELEAANLLRTCEASAGQGTAKLVVRFFSERDLSFLKMLAQKLTKLETAIALLGCGGDQPSLIFAQTPGLPDDMGARMKDAVQRLGTRGGGNRDMAQGGAPDPASAERALQQAAAELR